MAAPTTRFAYNGVNLSHTWTERFDTSPEHDPSGTDTTLFKTSIAVESVISPDDYPALPGESPGETADRVAALLCSPRRRLIYTVGGDTRTVDGRDDENGPQPDPAAFSIKHVGEGAFTVRFAISFKLRRCTGANARGYLSL